MEQAKILVGDFNYQDNRTYTWRKEWISEYESPWSILEKFRYANAFNDKDIFNIFGTNESKRKEIKSEKNRNLITMNGLDQNALKSILGIDIKGLNEYYKTKFLDIFLMDQKKKNYSNYYVESVVFCPECIKYGFHSVLHQMIIIEKCPFHNVGYFSHCPHCKKSIPYTIYNEKLKKPFHCSCGRSLIGEKINFNITKSWPLASKFTIVPNTLRLLMSLSERNVSLTERIYFQEELAKRFGGKILDFILQAVCNTENTDTNTYNHCTLKLRKNIYNTNSSKKHYYKKKA